jgi:hypothetical protein
MTELYFRDWDHLKSCFGSEHVRTTIGPDAINFNDLETAIPIMAIEKPLQFESPNPPSPVPKEGSRNVAVLFLASKSTDTETQLEDRFSSALLNALQLHAQNDVYGVQANIGIPSSQFDIRAYFGGKDMPQYPVVYKLYMRSSESVAAVRKAQSVFMGEMGEWIDPGESFIAFGKEGLVLDVGGEVKFDAGRQPEIV